jgi:transposase
MRPQTPFPPNTVARMKTLLSSTTKIDEYRRIQCVYLRGKYEYSASQIAEMVGLKLQTVKNIHAAYLKVGEFALILSGSKNERKHSYLTVEQEKAFLLNFEKRAQAGSILEVSQIYAALQKILGEKIELSMIYRMLHRHKWRKLVPRPTHPKGSILVREAFKKTLGT